MEPYHGRILDPACGPGGMFVQSALFVAERQKNPAAELAIHGVEKTDETGRLCRMNLADISITGMSLRERGPAPLNLSTINVEALSNRFKQSRHKTTDLEVLKAAIGVHLEKLIHLNRTRADFAEKFEERIESYNSGSRSIEELINDLLTLSRSLSDEQERHVRENMTEEELVIFDILTRPAPELSPEERSEVKKVAHDLLDRLKQLLVINWRQKAAARSQLKLSIEDALDSGLPHAYTPELYKQKCSALFEHVYENYPEAESGTYSRAG